MTENKSYWFVNYVNERTGKERSEIIENNDNLGFFPLQKMTTLFGKQEEERQEQDPMTLPVTPKIIVRNSFEVPKGAFDEFNEK